MKFLRYILVASILIAAVATYPCCIKKISNNPELFERNLKQTFLLIYNEYVEPISTKELFTYGCQAINEYFQIKRKKEVALKGSTKQIEPEAEQKEEKVADLVICSQASDGSVRVKVQNKLDINLAKENFSDPESTAEALWAIMKETLKSEDDFTAAFYELMNIFVMKLDPHSGFLSPKDYYELMSDTHGKFSGVGIEIGMQNEKITVIAPIEGTPAWKAGIKTADVIAKIDDVSTEGMSLMEAVSRIRGPEGTIVKLTINRPGEKEPLEFSIKRATIHVFSVKSRFLEPHTAYFRLITFHQTTDEELREAASVMFKRYKGQIKAIILDLRSNPGGLLEQAVNVADMFIKNGALVSTRTRNEQNAKSFVAKNDRLEMETLPLVVLIGPGSASASEIVAGAIKDNNRGLLLGMRTFGKGSVQSILNLEGGSALRLTTALYYTPSGRSIQAVGIEPHVEFSFLTKDGNVFEPFGERMLEGHLKPKVEPEKPLITFSGDLLNELYKKKGLVKEELDPEHPEREDFIIRFASQVLEQPNTDVNRLAERAKKILQTASEEASRLNVQITPKQEASENIKEEK